MNQRHDTGSKGHTFRARMKSMILGPTKQEKVASIECISIVLGLRGAKVRSNP